MAYRTTRDEILVLTGMAACYFRRCVAARVDPAFTLRSE